MRILVFLPSMNDPVISFVLLLSHFSTRNNIEIISAVRSCSFADVDLTANQLFIVDNNDYRLFRLIFLVSK